MTKISTRWNTWNWVEPACRCHEWDSGAGIGQVWGPTPKAASVRAVHRALELGVNGFDVAPRYGDGKAEDVLGRALQDRPDPVIVATKVRLSADDLFDVAGAVRRSMDASLRRLRRDAVDSLHFHNRLTPQRASVRIPSVRKTSWGPY